MSPSAQLVPSKPRILVVEDDPQARAMLAAWVRSEVGDVDLATTVASARALLNSKEFELCICDVNLPDGDGPDLVAEIGGVNMGVPVIFLTGNPTIETAIRSVRLRVVAYLVKPPNLDELGMLVRREVAAHRYRRLIGASRKHLRQWDDELARLESAAPGQVDGRIPTVNYLQLTLQHFATVLTELESSVATLAADQSGRAALSQVDLIAGLRRTVQVLEATRTHFKSRELGELRVDLSKLLRGLEAEASGKSV